MYKALLLFLIFLSFQAKGQQQSEFHYEEIKKIMEEPPSKDFYPLLLERYNAFDDKLTLTEYALIYYGFSYQDGYQRNQIHEKVLEPLQDEENYEELISVCEKILRENPVSLKANNLMAYSLYKSGKPEAEWEKYQDRYRTLRKVIVYSGDGMSCETAFKVIFVSDEYNMLYTYFDVEEIHEQTLVGLCDKFEVTPTEYLRSKHVFFDVSRSLLRAEELKK